jgi:ketosteroid isomerase-like protein
MKSLIIANICFLLVSCDLSFPKKDERLDALNDMQQTDADFADMAREQGYQKAFLAFTEDEAVLLRDNFLPIIGADAVQYIININDSSFRMTWEPHGGDVSGAGDMGFTFGVYEMQTDAERQSGTYVTIWRKQKDGTWKYILNADTQGATAPLGQAD